ncbi:serine/threonine-protein kinase [Dokdonella soli]|uniref:Protein kinase domain-containing protein n=1 Tax=Dokdonella soli TaxID=529810 RepID=A0ABN1IQN8_9GAMM
MNAAFADRWTEIEPLLNRIFDVPDEARAAWLQRHCPDATLRALVERTLGNTRRAEALERGMSQWLPESAEKWRDDVIETALPRIAGYRVVDFIGAGGMASVFKAERDLPGGPQTVALKLLRVNVHDPQERARFLREQRILARLQHPHIAQLLDAGFTPTDTPYLALEFVAGDTLLAHCDRHRLGIRARLAVFVDVCTAVEHAHQNLVVHRDLKPSNVLVSTDGRVKLLDFGIAKLLTGDDDATRTEACRLTRAYAAPEQLVGDPATTAIDVYALGVLLGELLGCKRVGEGNGDITFGRVFDDAAAAARGLSASALRRQLRGDLAAIVRKATQADPNLRYASAAALRGDLLGYLRGEPIQARPDAPGYRLLKFVQRHTLGFAFAALLAATMAAATAFSAKEAALANRSADRAEDEAARAHAVQSFLQGLFDSATPGAAAAENAEELLARGRERADRDFAASPVLRVEILGLIGDLQRRSGYPDHAREPLESAATLARQTFGAGDKRTLYIEYLLAKLAYDVGHFREGAARLQQALDDFHTSAHAGSKEEVQAMAWLGGLHQRIGDSRKAEALGGDALAIARRILPPDDTTLTEAVTNLGWVYTETGRPTDAVSLLGEALASKRRLLGEQHADVADAMALLASAMFKLGRYGEAEQLMRGAAAIDAKAYSRPHPRVASHLNDLATALALEDKLDEAIDYYQQSIALGRRIFANGDLNSAIALTNVAGVRFEQGLYADAEVTMRSGIAEKTRLLGADYIDNDCDYDKASLARILIPLGRLDEAQGLLDEAIAEGHRRRGGSHADVAFALVVQARLLAARGDHAQAATSAREAVALYGALEQPNSSKAIAALLVLGENLRALDRNSEARTILSAALDNARASSPPAPSMLVRALTELARTEDALGHSANALELRTEARASIPSIPPGRNIERDEAKRWLAEMLTMKVCLTD